MMNASKLTGANGENRRSFAVRLADALDGLRRAYRSERNLRLQVLAGSLALAGGFLLGIDAAGWLWVLASISTVLSLELGNTALEAVVDLASPEFHPLARYAKHVAASAVVVAAAFSLGVAWLVLWPRFLPSLPDWGPRMAAQPGAAAFLGSLVAFSLAGVFLPIGSRQKG